MNTAQNEETVVEKFNDTVEIPRRQHEMLMTLARQFRAMMSQGPSWVSAQSGDHARDFDVTTESAAFAKFMRQHRDASASFFFELSSQQTQVLHRLAQDLATLDLHPCAQEGAPTADAPVLEPGNESAWPEETDEAAHAAHQAALRDAADNAQLVCSECSRAALVTTEQRESIGLSPVEGVSAQEESVRVLKIVCTHCGHAEESPFSSAARRQALCTLLSRRMMLKQPIDSTDLYSAMDELYEQMLYTGTLLLEALQEVVKVIHNPDGPTFDSAGLFTGHFVLDPEDEWECEVFEQLQVLGLLRCVGGVLYQAVPAAQQPVNPFATPLIEPFPTGTVH